MADFLAGYELWLKKPMTHEEVLCGLVVVGFLVRITRMQMQYEWQKLLRRLARLEAE